MKIRIDASPELVYQAIQDRRKGDWPELSIHRDYVSYEKPIATLREVTYNALCGTVVSTWQEIEISPNRIDFKLVSSDKFVEGFGVWLINPVDDGVATELEMQCYLDTGIRVPFWRQITRCEVRKDMQKRLKLMKQDLEEK